MLARIDDLAPDAASDHSGALLRFIDHGQTAQVRVRLYELGYESEELDPSESQELPESQWYRPADLSREEARVLASRITPAFGRQHAVDPAVAAALQDCVEAALFGCFVANPLGSAAAAGSLRTECAAAVAAAAGHILGPNGARALGEFVDRWLGKS
ncbi:MAG: hypothetical protein E6I40_10260 [Chloroflexi bacterium]|nr:MAG: hypothetical protein E6I40_10260 [Chloroflexota bacterium]